MDICVLKHALEILSVIFALASAALWFAAAWVGRPSLLDTPLLHLVPIQRRANMLNAFAALSTGLAVSIQLIVMLLMPVCRAFA
jgi:hypothetical protein